MGTFSVIVDLHAELGGKNDFVSSALQNSAEEFFALGEAVDVGGVEEVNARVEGGINDFFCLCLVDAAAEVVSAKPNN